VKSYGQLWDRIVSEDNIDRAWRRFRRHHAASSAAVKFASAIDFNLRAVRRHLIDGDWRASDYYQFKIYEPKPRIISCVPVRDRVVHHALCNVITPLIEQRFIDQSYACRERKGAHKACVKALELTRRYRYFLKVDVHHYFDSIDHGILLGLLRQMFREREVMQLIEKIVTHRLPNTATGKGLPIGNLTSQWFANFYLDGLDHRLVDGRGLGARYIRYMDDIVIFGDSKAELWSIYDFICEWLADERRLTLKAAATTVAPVTEGVPFLGLRIRPSGWRFLRKRFMRTRRSARRQVRDFLAGTVDPAQFQNNLRSMEGTSRWFGFKGIYGFLDHLPEETRISAKGEDEATGGSSTNCSNRGGSWNNTNADNFTGAYRNNNNPNNTNTNLGFRLASIRQGNDKTGRIPSREPALRADGDEHDPGATGPVSAAKAAANVLCLALPTAGARAVLRDGGDSVSTIGHKSFHGHKSFQHNTKGNNA